MVFSSIKQLLYIAFNSQAIYIYIIINNNISDKFVLSNNSNFGDILPILQKYPKAKINIYIDNDSVELSHTSLPLIEDVSAASQAKEYLQNKFSVNHIYSYILVDDLQKQRQIINTVSVQSFELLEELLTYCYSLAHNVQQLTIPLINIPNFLNRITKQKKYTYQDTCINIVAFVTEANGLKIVIICQSVIYTNYNIKLPQNQSLEYLQGFIEHHVKEKRLEFQKLFNHLQCVFWGFFPKNLYEMFLELKLDFAHVELFNNSYITKLMDVTTRNLYADLLLLLPEYHINTAQHHRLQSLNKIHRVNWWVRLCSFLVLGVIGGIFASVMYNRLVISNRMKLLENSKANLIKDYRQIYLLHSHSPNFYKNFHTYTAQQLLAKTFEEPWGLLDRISQHLLEYRGKINDFSWYMPYHKEFHLDKQIKATMQFEYEEFLKSPLSDNEALSKMKLKLASLRKSLEEDNYELSFNIDDVDIIKSPIKTKMIIDVVITRVENYN